MASDNPSGYNPYLRQPFAWEDSVDTTVVFDSAVSFSGGQNSYAKARQLNPDQSSLLLDCEEEITGQCSTRFGTVQLGGNVGAAGNIDALRFFNTPGFVYEVAHPIGSGPMYYLSGGTWTALPSTGMSSITSMVQGVNKLYVCGDSDIDSWDGTTVVGISGDGATQAPRNASILVWHTNRLIAAGNIIKSYSTDPVAVPDAIYFSNLLDPATWGTSKDAMQVRVGAGDGIPITSLVPWNGFNLAVFKRHSVWVIVADPTLAPSAMQIQRVHPTVGCVARKTAVQVGSDIMFLADDGVRSLSQVIGSDQQHELGVPMSFQVQDIINRINWNTVSLACAVFWRNRYILSLPIDGSATNNYLLVFNTITGAWTGIWTGLSVSCFAVRESGGISRLMFGLATDKKVVEYLDYVNPEDWTDSTFQDYWGNYVQPRIRTRAFLLGAAISAKIGFGGEIEWNNSKGSLVVTPILDENTREPFTIDIPSGGFTVPFTPPFLVSGIGLGRKQFDLIQYGEFRELQFDIIGSGAGRKEIRQIALSGAIRPTLVGNS